MSRRYPAPIMERILAKVELTESGCWQWTGRLNDGYGQIGYRHRAAATHRVVYEELVGPVPVGLQIDHLCRNRACCRPEHLEPVTQRENLLRGQTIAAQNASRTHCPQDHPYAGENLFINNRGARVCRACMRAQRAAWRARKKASAA